MNVKRGVLVSHTGGNSWGVGKVVEVSPLKATIQFSDGITRMIASSHFNILEPADHGSFIPAPDSIPAAKVRATVKRVKKAKALMVAEP
jgi:transcription elongation factor GreA-like protein